MGIYILAGGTLPLTCSFFVLLGALSKTRCLWLSQTSLFLCLCHSLRVYVLVTSRFVLVVSTYFNLFDHILNNKENIIYVKSLFYFKILFVDRNRSQYIVTCAYHKRIGRFLLFLFYFLVVKNYYRPATSSSRFGLDFGGCDILFLKTHDHLE